jgi:hypothetical protein
LVVLLLVLLLLVLAMVDFCSPFFVLGETHEIKQTVTLWETEIALVSPIPGSFPCGLLAP